ncbi:conserved hypothetical protein [Planktothrix serta PCC 8927]|uniref:Uncharacterized protein n=1 Tax=Planktothrix serta PCC 8927 TaxID=671068 RepID=A0A7Z9BS43_9CYAN|nr:hypothetical protein [Planktothrix serta]VXD19957.1 conserved hypothetical protein [Planktothrix serta PCC 8927]
MNSQTNPKSDYRIFAPNVYLFTYCLINNAKKLDNPLWKQGDKILKAFSNQTITEHLVFPDDLTSDRLYLFKDSYLAFTSTQNPEIEGFAQPQKIQDSYALWLNIGYSDEDETVGDVEVEVLQKLNPNHILILPKDDKILGQTLLITAWLTNKTKQRDPDYLRKLADQCCQNLLGDKTPPFYRTGELFESAIFEYGKPDRDPQVLVWLFRDENADQQYNKYQQELIALFFYRTKIVKAFADSRLVYTMLDQAYSLIADNLDNLQTELATRHDISANDNYLKSFKTELKNLAKESLPYTRLLRKMEDFGNTIEINLYNYQETIEQICGKLEIDKEELSFLKYFGEQTAPYFERQIKADLGYFKHGTDLVNTAIASIRGIVEIDQADANQSLQDHIQAIGVGIAAGAIFASVSGLITQPWSLPSRDHIFLFPHPFVIALLASILCSWGAFWFSKKVIKKRRSTLK